MEDLDYSEEEEDYGEVDGYDSLDDEVRHRFMAENDFIIFRECWSTKLASIKIHSIQE